MTSKEPDVEKLKSLISEIKEQYIDLFRKDSNFSEIFSKHIQEIEEMEKKRRDKVEETYVNEMKFVDNEFNEAKRAIEDDAKAQKEEADMKIRKSILFKKEKLFEEFKNVAMHVKTDEFQICRDNSDNDIKPAFASYEVTNEPFFSEVDVHNMSRQNKTEYSVNNNLLLLRDNVLHKCSLVLSSGDEVDVSVVRANGQKVTVCLDGVSRDLTISMKCLESEFCKLKEG